MATNVFKKGSTEARTAKSFLHDITVGSGLRSNDQRQNGSIQLSKSLINAASIVCKEVINRAFNDVDAEIIRLTNLSFKSNLTGPRADYINYSADEVAKALIYLAECLNVYWDDLNATTHERDTFSKTLLGTMAKTYGRLTSMISTTAAPAQVPTAPTTKKRASTSTSTATANKQPKNGYKSSGGQSANVRDLKGKPGVKVYANGNEVYRIVGENSAIKNIPTVFIRPVTAGGASGNTNKVFVNSGNGYTDCHCWFDDYNEAQQFLKAVLANTTIDPNITNLHVVRTTPDPNGYFLVGTEYGVCAILAKKLNEALEEELLENVDTEHTVWDTAYEGASREDKEDVFRYMRQG